MKIKIDLKNLKAVSYAMNKKDSWKKNMMGVLLETNGKETRIVATDSNRLHLVVEKTNGKKMYNSEYFIPISVVNEILKFKTPKQSKDTTIEFEFSKEKFVVTLPNGVKIENEISIEKFPDYRRVIPEKLGEEIPANYNVKFLSDAYKGLEDYSEDKNFNKMGIYQRGKQSGIISKDSFLALIMPVIKENVSEENLKQFTLG